MKSLGRGLLKTSLGWWGPKTSQQRCEEQLPTIISYRRTPFQGPTTLSEDKCPPREPIRELHVCPRYQERFQLRSPMWKPRKGNYGYQLTLDSWAERSWEGLLWMDRERGAYVLHPKSFDDLQTHITPLDEEC